MVDSDVESEMEPLEGYWCISCEISRRRLHDRDRAGETAGDSPPSGFFCRLIMEELPIKLDMDSGRAIEHGMQASPPAAAVAADVSALPLNGEIQPRFSGAQFSAININIRPATSSPVCYADRWRFLLRMNLAMVRARLRLFYQVR